MSKNKLVNPLDLEQDLLEEYEFEINFFSYIAGTENFEIISIPDLEGFIPNEDEYKILQEEYKRRGIKPIYRISMGKYALVYDISLEKVGMVPEENPNGFPC